jgi:hypothetical protein
VGKVAEAQSIDYWSTIKLLRMMVTAARIDMDKGVEILGYWDDEKDLPMPKENLRKVFVEYFGSDPDRSLLCLFNRALVI